MVRSLSAESESGAKPNQDVFGDIGIEKTPNESSQLASPPIGNSSSAMDPSHSPLNTFDKRLHRNNNTQLSVLDTHEDQTANASSNPLMTEGFTSRVAHEQTIFEASGASTTETSTDSTLAKDQVSSILIACGNGVANCTGSNESEVTAAVNKHKDGKTNDSLSLNENQTLAKPQLATSRLPFRKT